MRITKIELSKSETVGYLDLNGKTKFRKVSVSAEATLLARNNKEKSFDALSSFVDNCIEKEKKAK